MKFLALLPIIFTLASQNINAQNLVKVPTKKTYKSGRTLCKENEKLISYQNGFYVEVPLDYKNPAKGKTPIYVWFEKGYNKNLPTVAHFTGGPGQTSHWGSGELPFPEKYNFLTYDLRGLGCSKPDRLEDYLDPNFHSSENMARDLEEIRKHLKIEMLSVHGVSFGTLPATIYGSLFAKSTRAVILEGTAFSSETIFKFPQRKKILLEVLKSLPRDIQDKAINLTSKHGMSPSWFFKWTRDQLIVNNGKEKLRNNLLRLADAKEFKGFLEELESNYGLIEDIPTNELFISNNVMYYMLTCQELSTALPSTSFELQWNPAWVAEWNKNPALITLDENDTSMFINYYNEAAVSCKAINIDKVRPYSAANYPLHVPVTYVQGLNDSATEVHGAVLHYQQSAKGFRQLLIMNNGGHNPLAENLMISVPGSREIFWKAIMGESLTEEDIRLPNKSMEKTKWFLHKPN